MSGFVLSAEDHESLRMFTDPQDRVAEHTMTPRALFERDSALAVANVHERMRWEDISLSLRRSYELEAAALDVAARHKARRHARALEIFRAAERLLEQATDT